jgi:hypothetical protein
VNIWAATSSDPLGISGDAIVAGEHRSVGCDGRLGSRTLAHRRATRLLMKTRMRL